MEIASEQEILKTKVKYSVYSCFVNSARSTTVHRSSDTAFHLDSCCSLYAASSKLVPCRFFSIRTSFPSNVQWVFAARVERHPTKDVNV